MRYHISIVDTSGNVTVLGNDREQWTVSVDQGMPKAIRQPRIHPLFRARSPKIYDNGNTAYAYGFSVDRSFNSLPDALRHKYFHAGKVPNVGTLIVRCDGFLAKLRSCSIIPVCTRVDGASVVFHYDCVGEEWIYQ